MQRAYMLDEFPQRSDFLLLSQFVTYDVCN